MTKSEKLTDNLIAILKDECALSGPTLAMLRRKFEATLTKELEAPAALAESLAETEKALGGPQLYTTHDVARMLQVDASTVAKWIDKKMLVAFRTPGGHRRVRATDFRTFCATHNMPITGASRAA